MPVLLQHRSKQGVPRLLLGLPPLDLSVPQTETLGLHAPDPRPEQEGDRPFAGPGQFVMDAGGYLQTAETANAAFPRPGLDALAKGTAFIRDPENADPIRGTRA